MKNGLRLTFLALLLFFSIVLVPVRGQGQGPGSQVDKKRPKPQTQTQPVSNPAPSPSPRLKANEIKANEIKVTRVKVAPSTVEFVIYQGFHSETKQIEITDEDQSNEWTFVRLKRWPRHLQFKVESSAPGSQTLDQGKPVPADQWIGFKNKITLDVTLGEEDAASPDRMTVTVEKGSAELPNDSRESATKAISADAIKPTGEGQIAVAWQRPIVVPPSDEWDPVTKALLWLVGVTVVLVALVVLLKLSNVWDRLAMRFHRSSDRRKRGKREREKRERAERESTPEGEIGNASTGTKLSITQLKAELVQQIKAEFLAEVNRLIAENKLDEGKLSVNARLKELEATLKPLTSLKSELSRPIYQATEKSDSGFREVDQRFRELRETMEKGAHDLLRRQKEFEDARWEVIAERVEQEHRIERQLTDVREQLERQIEPNVTYSQMLGELFGNSVGVAGEDNFHELGEAVNDFFRHQVSAPDDNLLRLKQRGQAIGSSVEALLVKARQANGVVDSDLGKHVERVRQILAELDAFYSQLTDRQLDLFVTNLRIPVAIHAGARDGFLDELGAALKREIEKLRQPAAYFERQFRQLATSEIVAIADICDKKINQSPGSNPDLEVDLEALFEHAGLKSILPRQMDDFQSSCQDLVEVVTALELGVNRKIARVISRGFSYEEDNRKDLLRKAAVVIYG